MNAFWGVVVGSLITLFGVSRSNLASERRMREQIDSDRRLKDREREMTFKKDTYAAAAEAIAVTMTALSKMTHMNLSDAEISSTYIDNAPVVAKVNLVAGEELIEGLAAFGAEFTGAFLRLMQRRRALMAMQQEIGTRAASLVSFEKTRDAMIELMRHHNIQGLRDAGRFEAIQKIYDFEAASSVCERRSSANGGRIEEDALCVCRRVLQRIRPNQQIADPGADCCAH